jgi:hypothetical protein
MFIATKRSRKVSLRRSETWKRKKARHEKAVTLLQSAGGKKNFQPIDISPRWGEEANNLRLHFQSESDTDN